MTPDDTGGFWDWLDDDHPDRRRAVDEILKRSDYGICPYGRVSQVIRTHPTFAEMLRDAIAEHPPTQPRDATLDTWANEAERESKLRRKRVRDFISDLAPKSTQASLMEPDKKLLRALHYLEGRIAWVSKAGMDGEPYDNTSGRTLARKDIETIRDLYRPGQPLHPDWSKTGAPSKDPGRDAVPALMPYRPGDAANKYWFNLWRDAPTSDPYPERHTERDLRMAWEGFYDHQATSLWEDFVNDAAASKADFFSRDREGALLLNTHRTGHDAWRDWYLRWRGELQAGGFKFKGRILGVSHIWTFPVQALLTDPDSRESQALIGRAVAQLAEGDFRSNESSRVLDTVTRFASRSFHQRDQTRADAARDDLVISIIGAGEAILVCDFRPYSRDAKKTERAARTMLVTLSMPAAKTGRVIRRILDIATYRMLGLRDYQYVFRVRDVLDTVGARISRKEAAARISHRKSRTRRQKEQWARARLDYWLELSSCVSALNQFVNGGITGLHADMTEHQKRIHTRIADLRETPLPGHQSLTSYLRRFDNAVGFVEALQEKYAAIRERLDEMVNFAKAELEGYESENAKERTRMALLISGLLISASLTGLATQAFKNASAPSGGLDPFMIATTILVSATIILGAMVGARLLHDFQVWLLPYLNRIRLRISRALNRQQGPDRKNTR